MLAAENICFSYNRSQLLQDLTFQAAPGECIALAGPNGSGKSTALSLIAGIAKPDSGQIRKEGKIGLIPQGNALFDDMTVQDNLTFFAGLAHAAIPRELPLSVGSFLNKKVSSLSGGMKKRVSIVCALLGDPDILLFDEPCAGLDILYQEELAALIRELKAAGRTILYVGHDTAEYESFYDQLIFLSGPKPRLFTRKDLSGSSCDPAEEAKRLRAAYRRLCEDPDCDVSEVCV